MPPAVPLRSKVSRSVRATTCPALEEVLLILRTTNPVGLGASLVPASEPLRNKALACTEPATSRAVVGLATPMPTPPLARIRNWLLAVGAKSAPVESPQTDAP